ncbi:hypothetical protein BN2497_12963 [Janthinobacterium sp. CG23_2]|nr:hypothetical protein BN2497_12963 [Janthinobacterium sp. CG23_2]CUU32879.1 hypothetical protein BN3177_12963 [Janthinobacterium sp. CG23_2]
MGSIPASRTIIRKIEGLKKHLQAFFLFNNSFVVVSHSLTL